MEAKELLKNYVISILKKYEGDIYLRGYSHESILNECENTFEDVVWVITECLNRKSFENPELQNEMNKLFEFSSWDDSWYILQIEDKFIKMFANFNSDSTAEFVNKVEKMVPQITFE